MTDEIAVRTTLIAAAIVLIAVGVWHKDKMINFEDWLADKAAWLIALLIIKCRRLRVEIKIPRMKIALKLIVKEHNFMTRVFEKSERKGD